VAPGAVFEGVVSAGGSGLDTLELAKGANHGTLAGIGTSFTGFTNLDIDAGAHWTIGRVVDLAYGGLVDLGAGSTTELRQAIVDSFIYFASGGGGTLALDRPHGIGAGSQISGFDGTDTIDLLGLSNPGFSTFHRYSHKLVVGGTSQGDPGSVTIRFSQSYFGHQFTTTDDGHGGTLIHLV
jgi:hypothetical protein